MKTKSNKPVFSMLIGAFAILMLLIGNAGCKREGCTDSKAINYDSKAKKDDGSCVYRDTVTVTVQVHDTIRGKSISGLCTYPNFSGVQTAAAGAVISLYLGTSATGNPVATAYADTSGNYLLPYLLPNNYFVFAKYNTENQNYKTPIDGINFETNPGYAVVMASVDLTQNLTLATVAAAGTTKIALDTTVNLFRKVTLDKAHSRISFETDYGPSGQGATFPGFFGAFSGQPSQTAFNLTKFAFDEANPANIVIEGYVLMHEISTGEDGRDALGKCGTKALFIDTAGMGLDTLGKPIARPETDTCKLISTSVEKYGKGYLCHAILRGFLMHSGPGDPICPTCPPDTALGYNGPWDVTRDLAVDMYFEYGGKQYYPGTNWYYGFPFEGVFTFDKTKFNIKHASIGNEFKVNCHVNIKGTPKVEY